MEILYYEVQVSIKYTRMIKVHIEGKIGEGE